MTWYVREKYPDYHLSFEIGSSDYKASVLIIVLTRHSNIKFHPWFLPLPESKRLVLGLDEVREEPESFEIETMCKKISDDMAKMSTAYNNNNGVQNNNNDMHKTSTAQNDNNDVVEMSTVAEDEQLPPVDRELKVQ